MHNVLYMQFYPNGEEAMVKKMDRHRTRAAALLAADRFNAAPVSRRRGGPEGGYIKAFVSETGGNISHEIKAEEEACVKTAVTASKINALTVEHEGDSITILSPEANARYVNSFNKRKKTSKGRSRSATHASGHPKRDDAPNPQRRRRQGGTGGDGPVHRRDRPAKRIPDPGQHSSRTGEGIKKLLAKKSHAPSPEEYRILVCGSRDWPDTAMGIIRAHVTQAIEESGVDPKNILIITGSTTEDDNGVDSMVDQLCRTDLGIACAIFRAPWEWARRTIGTPRPAGPIRNAWMLRWGRPHLVLAFHPYLPNSRGTKNMCEQARDKGIAVRTIDKIK